MLIMENKIPKDTLYVLAAMSIERGDPTRCVGWKELLPQLKNEQPLFIAAWENLKEAERVFEAAAKGLLEKANE